MPKAPSRVAPSLVEASDDPPGRAAGHAFWPYRPLELTGSSKARVNESVIVR